MATFMENLVCSALDLRCNIDDVCAGLRPCHRCDTSVIRPAQLSLLAQPALAALRVLTHRHRAGQRLPYDHRHRAAGDKGIPYAFESAQRLMEDFFAEVDRVINEAQP